MEHLYLDESGSFEGHTPADQDCFIGGFVTRATPADCAQVLRSLVDQLHADGVLAADAEPSRLHATEHRKDPARMALLRQRSAEALGAIGGFRLVSCHWFEDADILVDIASDARAFNRYLRMWSTLVRNVAWFATWSAPDLFVHTAQRSFPKADLGAGDHQIAQTYVTHSMGPTEGVRVAATEQLPQMLKGLISARARAQFSRRIVGADVGSALAKATWERVSTQPELAGLLLADLACDLIRCERTELDQATRAITQKWPHFAIAYSPSWHRVEELLEWSGRSDNALADLIDLACGATKVGNEGVSALAKSRASDFAASILADPSKPLRAAAVRVAKADLAAKEARFPRADFIFANLPQPAIDADNLKEWVQRTIHANHSGQAGGNRRDDLQSKLEPMLNQDLDAVLGHLETIAVLAVGHQDDFDFDRAIGVATPWLERGKAIAGVMPDAPWTDLGRLASNVAQSLACRGNPEDLEQACELMRFSRRHLRTSLDLAQWACHAANVATLADDAVLRRETWTILFEEPNPSGALRWLKSLVFRPGDPLHTLFAGTVVTRSAIVGQDELSAELRSMLTSADHWHTLVENVEEAGPGHPLERYLRHLAELAPATESAKVEALVGRALMSFGNLDTSQVAPLQGACTLAAVALARNRAGDVALANELARRVVPTLMRRYQDNEWAAPTILMPDGYDGGWLTSSVEALRKDLSAPNLTAFVERFRYEWR